ncbi:Rid family hydrolase [Streptomyces achromogenes]|uniref:Rid family hydrolase n=1 Tax=Streptomyces achromogenes TaxID=67255 RepID=UPI0036D174B9
MSTYAVTIPEDSAVFGATTGGFARFEYSAAVRAHGLLFIAGQVGYRPDGSLPETIEEQTEWVLRRTEEILRIEGLAMSDLVEVVSYHPDMQEHLAGFLETKKRFVKEPFPAWSMIGVSGLARPEFLLEVRAVAAYPDSAAR